MTTLFLDQPEPQDLPEAAKEDRGDKQELPWVLQEGWTDQEHLPEAVHRD